MFPGIIWRDLESRGAVKMPSSIMAMRDGWIIWMPFSLTDGKEVLMAVVEKTIDILGDDAFCERIIARRLLTGDPVDIYDEVVQSLRNYAFYRMAGVQSLKLTKLKTVNTYACANITSLLSLELPECTTVSDSAFRGCSGLKELNLPLVTSTGSYSFVDCAALEKVQMDRLATVGTGTFQNCKKLQEIILPRASTIMNAAFYSCDVLKKLDLPSATQIRSNIFTSSVEELNIGPNISSIATDAFRLAGAGLVINLPVAEGVISGAPWGATDAVINYEVPYSGDVPMPT